MAEPQQPSPLAIDTIFHEIGALDYPRTHEIFARFPDAERIPIESHQDIPGLYEDAGNVESWTKIKRGVLVLGVKKSISARPNSRSTDWIAPSLANGCALACAYCYVPRRKGYANPITTFVNFERIAKYLVGHNQRQGPKVVTAENEQTDPVYWTYDIGENSDCSVDDLVGDNIKDAITLFRDRMPHGKASFATKFVNERLLEYDPQGKTRVRFSLLPSDVARVVDVRTSPVRERVRAIEEFWRAGYEVHLNFSPVILYEGWERDYIELFEMVDAAITRDACRRQLRCEVIFLTHNEQLHRVNMGWHPKAETEYLWRYVDPSEITADAKGRTRKPSTNRHGLPVLQQRKLSQNGMVNLRYRNDVKGPAIARFRELLGAHLPYCGIRYIF